MRVKRRQLFPNYLLDHSLKNPTTTGPGSSRSPEQLFPTRARLLQVQLDQQDLQEAQDQQEVQAQQEVQEHQVETVEHFNIHKRHLLEDGQ